MKTIAIGDIHGCLTEITKLIELINIEGADKIVFLGDMIDRGEDSCGVVSFVRNIQNKYGTDKIIVLRGNHEQMALDYMDGTNRLDWFRNGGRKALESYENKDEQLENDISWFKTLPLKYDDGFRLYVHAGINPWISLELQRDDDLIWIREAFYEKHKRIKQKICFGHTPTTYINGTTKPFIEGNIIGIDTGCVKGGALTAIHLVDGELVNITQVQKGK